MNYVHIVGHLGKDAETRFTTSGDKVTTLVIATNTRKGKEDITIWWRISIWGDRYEKMIPYLTKGKPVMVGGELSNKPEMYDAKDGSKQVGALEVRAEYVKFLPAGKTDPVTGERSAETNPSFESQQGTAPSAPSNNNEEPLPF